MTTKRGTTTTDLTEIRQALQEDYTVVLCFEGKTLSLHSGTEEWRVDGMVEAIEAFIAKNTESYVVI